ncbi:hypothetical protein DICPUDRAFT_29956 [Dictyostelium purpureum]|uniref:Arginyl-tRNA--protein transferase 1 n=1 Tax=Dictyostelium purpureum TaxID=5786 RepID=F0ZEI2_DICPU|nr:uncharacterized protein DICPUDRAFT_29956 [Dictyostelium purpureum]EGC37630.1 hypothetical protein DICPUDRAFT_29956 [Dictyostelium purpureum]|eukprot:XP_003285818.1 hypothetical protein DICPUDRAFT_29956 [Dictyostelium purpureum]
MNIKKEESLVYPQGSYSSECNYCGESENGRICFGMTCYQLTVEDYQSLIDIGWRRSGTFLYKPDNPNGCCPQYTIRLEALNFRPSKDNIKTKKKFQNYIAFDEKPNKTKIINEHNQMDEDDNRPSKTTQPSTSTSTTSTSTTSNPTLSKSPTLPNIIYDLNKFIIEILHKFEFASNSFSDINSKKTIENNLKIKINAKKSIKEKGNYSISFGIFNKFKKELEESLISIDQIIDFILNYYSNDKNQFIEQFKLTLGENNHINIIDLKNTDNHITSHNNSNNSNSNSNNKTSKLKNIDPSKVTPKHKFEVTIHKPQCTDEVFNLYCKYQTIIHKETDKKTKSGFSRFLVDTPLIEVPHAEGTDDEESNNDEAKEREDETRYLKTKKFGNIKVPKPGYGSYHQYYRIDGKLVAVGVIDILPLCLSSVYFFYDPDYNFLNLGKYSSLLEIDWVRRCATVEGISQLKYYYMGYYIHTCQKMKYKGKYQPSQLLCSENNVWVEFNKAISKLKDKRYSKFYFENEEQEQEQVETKGKSNEKTKTFYEKDNSLLDSTRFKQGNMYFKYSEITPRFQKMLKDHVIEYINHVGELSKDLIFTLK